MHSGESEVDARQDSTAFMPAGSLGIDSSARHGADYGQIIQLKPWYMCDVVPAEAYDQYGQQARNAVEVPVSSRFAA